MIVEIMCQPRDFENHPRVASLNPPQARSGSFEQYGCFTAVRGLRQYVCAVRALGRERHDTPAVCLQEGSGTCRPRARTPFSRLATCSQTHCCRRRFAPRFQYLSPPLTTMESLWTRSQACAGLSKPASLEISSTWRQAAISAHRNPSRRVCPCLWHVPNCTEKGFTKYRLVLEIDSHSQTV